MPMLKTWMNERNLQQRSTTMQTRTWAKRFDPGQVKLILIAVSAIAIMLLGTILSTTFLNSGDQAVTTDRTQTSEVARPTSNARFLGWNILPGDPGTYPVTGQRDYRFRDWNILPGDPGTYETTSLQEYLFQGWNILPGDDARFVPPAHERGARY